MLVVELQTFAERTGELLDVVGVSVVLGGFALSTLAIFIRMFKAKSVHHVYRMYRQNLARSILVSLEFLIAGDILRSVAGDLTFQGVGILAVLILIRLMLGISLEMEIDGHWPWQRTRKKT